MNVEMRFDNRFCYAGGHYCFKLYNFRCWSF